MSETAEAAKMSATRLGLERGLSAEVINFALKLAGLQDGEPGAWWATEEGAPYVAEQFRQRGTGGYAHFNPSWEWLTWDPAVIDELDLSGAGIARIRQVIADRKLAQKAAREAATAAADAAFLATQAAKHAADAAPDVGSATRARVIVGLGVAVTAYGIYKAVPLVRRRRQQRADAQQARDRTDRDAPPENLT
jgi:hypothetical protein